LGTVITGSAFPTGTLTAGTTALSYINIPQAGIWLISAIVQLDYTGTLVGYFGFSGIGPSCGIGLAMEVTGSASSSSACNVLSLSVSQIALSLTFSGGSGVVANSACVFKVVRIG
jgi:hypothetical protein